MTDEQRTFLEHDPQRYRKLDEPFPTGEALSKAVDDFLAEVGELRMKHKLPDVHIIIRACALDPETGREGDGMSICHLGNTALVECMAAYAFGHSQAKRQGQIDQVVSEATKTARKRYR